MSFGRKGAVAGTADQMAARRAAFLAEERARKASAPAPARQEERSYEMDGRLPPASLPGGAQRNVVEKSTGIAYLIWFFLGGIGAHRFYLGFTTSGIIQLILAPLGYVMLFSKETSGIFLVIGAGIWILADAFLIPGMVRKANSRARQESLGPVFA